MDSIGRKQWNCAQLTECITREMVWQTNTSISGVADSRADCIIVARRELELGRRRELLQQHPASTLEKASRKGPNETSMFAGGDA